MAQPKVLQHRKIPVQNLVPALPAGHRHRQISRQPALVDPIEFGDRLVIDAVFQIPRLHLVDAVDFGWRNQ